MSSEGMDAAAGSLPRRFLATLWKGWKNVAGKIATVQTFILLLIIFVVVVGPIALIMRLLGKDPMKLSKGARTFWVFRPNPRETLEDCTRQF